MIYLEYKEFMEIIKSSSNQYIKLLRSLKDKKYRNLHNLYVAEGKTLLSSIRDYSLIHSIYVRVDCLEKNKDILDKCECPIHIIENNIFNAAHETMSPSGISAIMTKSQERVCYDTKGRTLILDRISDPGNLGTILRTATALDYSAVYLINCADAYSGKAVRASMGGIFSIKLYEISLSDVTKIKGPKICLNMSGDSVYDVVLPDDNYVIIVGSEAHGVSKDLIDMSDYIVSLPMSDKMESLNASIACSVVMYLLGGLK